MKHFTKYLLVGSVLFGGCGDDESSRPMDREYFPLQTGFYQIYEVEENIYSELTPPVSNIYELKTEVVDSFPNQEGGITYVIHRSKRNTESDPWEFIETWSARITASEAVSIEGNVSFVRIGFPAVENKSWNGNALNLLEADMYLIASSGNNYQLDTNLKFNDAIIINQEEEVNELIRDEREEVYARHVGLIYKKSIVLNYCDEVPCFGQEIINDGVEYWQVLKEYGQN